MGHKGKITAYPHEFILIGIILSIIFWLLESAMHAYVFEDHDFVTELLYPNIHEAWMRIVIVFLFIGFGSYAEIIMKKRKAAERALAESEGKYRQIIETSEEGIWVIDASNRTAFANNRMAEMLGVAPEEIVGRPFFDFMDQEAVKSAQAYIERRHRGIKEQHDFRFLRKDGTELWAIVSTAPITGPDGEYSGALGMITDITERKLAEEALKQRIEELERFRKATINREFRLKELKDKVLELEGRMGKLTKRV